MHMLHIPDAGCNCKRKTITEPGSAFGSGRTCAGLRARRKLRCNQHIVLCVAIERDTFYITERIKWNAPSFYYKGDMAVFHPRATHHVHVVFPNGIVINDPAGLLEGDYKDRRMAYFYTLEDVQSKKAALENIVNDWVRIMDA